MSWLGICEIIAGVGPYQKLLRKEAGIYQKLLDGGGGHILDGYIPNTPEASASASAATSMPAGYLAQLTKKVAQLEAKLASAAKGGVEVEKLKSMVSELEAELKQATPGGLPPLS